MKGIVEVGVKYVNGHVLRARSFRDMVCPNPLVREWVPPILLAGTR